MQASSLTGVLRVHMGRIKAEVDEEGDRHSELEPLHHVGWLLAVQGGGHVAPQDHALSGARRHKARLLSHSVDTWERHTDTAPCCLYCTATIY